MNFILYAECYLIHSLSCFAFRKTLNSFSASKAGPTKVTGFSIFHLTWASVTYKLLILSLSYTTTLSRAGCRQHCCYHREAEANFHDLHLWVSGRREGSETWTSSLKSLDNLSTSIASFSPLNWLVFYPIIWVFGQIGNLSTKLCLTKTRCFQLNLMRLCPR